MEKGQVNGRRAKWWVEERQEEKRKLDRPGRRRQWRILRKAECSPAVCVEPSWTPGTPVHMPVLYNAYISNISRTTRQIDARARRAPRPWT